jgi:hypothetical protein
MTFTGTERLVRRIVEALKQPDSIESQSHLAQEYADTCRSVQLRLEQCGALLNEGNELQAVQLAEVEPSLLDLIRLLGFREAPEWLDCCHQHKLPAAVPFDAKIISRLNQAYAKGITADHPLIREYREAVLRRQDIPAMTALRSILRLNPTDQNAQGELARLEKKILAQKLEALDSLLSNGSDEAITNQVDEIEVLNFKTKASGSIFEEGLSRREAYLSNCSLADAKIILGQLEPLQSANSWEAAIPMVSRIAFLKSEHPFDFPAQESAKWKQAQDWLASRQTEYARDQEFQRACRELIQAVELCDDRQATQKQMTTSQLRADLELVVKRYRTVTDFGLKIPPEIENRYRKRYGILKSQVEKKQKNLSITIGTIAAAAIILCIVAGYFVHTQGQASSLVDQMARLRSARQVSAAESFLKDLPNTSGAYLSLPNVSAAKDQTATFVAEEHARKSKFDDTVVSLDSIAQKQFQGSAPDLVQKQFDDAQGQEKQLCQDFQPSAEAQLLDFQNKWEAFLIGYHDAHAKQFADTLSSLEQIKKDQLDFNRKPEDLGHSVDNLCDALAKLAPETTTQIPQLKLSDDLLARFSDLQAKVAPFQKALAKLEQDQASVRAASTLDAYSQALQSLSQNDLVGAPIVVDSKRVLDLAPTTDKLTGGLLMPLNSDGWTFFTANPHAPFYPTSNVLDPEKSIYDQLTVDPNVQPVYAYTIKGNTGEISTLLVQGQLTGAVDGETLTTKVVKDYRPAVSPDKLLFVQEAISGQFAVQGETNESQAFRNWNFSGLINDAGTNFNGGPTDAPVHQMLDQIVHDPNANSLFKAYIFSNVGQLLEAGKRNLFWGLQYTPSLRQALDQINRIGPPGSGDWMVPSIVKAKKKQWDDLFFNLSKISFLKQGETLRALCLRINQTGFDYVGFVDEKGNPQILQGRGVIPQLWGWSAQSTLPALLFISTGDGQKYTSATAPMPMTPLFAFKGDPQSILQIVRQDQRLTDQEYDNSVKPFLPAFFAPLTTNPTINVSSP